MKRTKKQLSVSNVGGKNVAQTSELNIYANSPLSSPVVMELLNNTKCIEVSFDLNLTPGKSETNTDRGSANPPKTPPTFLANCQQALGVILGMASILRQTFDCLSIRPLPAGRHKARATDVFWQFLRQSLTVKGTFKLVRKPFTIKPFANSDIIPPADPIEPDGRPR